ncbi:MAG: transposase [Octadecabacter sp.]|nr:transposase [Octadecabacter sp.]
MGTPKGIKKRFWSHEEKRSICLQTRAPGVSVAQVARRYAMNTNLIHKWLKDPRFAPVEQPEPDVTAATDDAVFLSVEVEGVTVVAEPTPVRPHAASGSPLTAQRVDIALSDGRRILVEGTTALAAVVAMVEGLSS